MTRPGRAIGFRRSGTPRVPHADPVVKGDRSGMGRVVGNSDDIFTGTISKRKIR
jgi:hypothetical protein